jgi:zinc transporter ZupT
MSFLAELKRRNVILMAGLYLVGAWLVVQVAATLLPVFEAPDWVMKALVGLLAFGFLAALVFSWIHELTPEGLRRDGDVAPAESCRESVGVSQGRP